MVSEDAWLLIAVWFRTADVGIDPKQQMTVSDRETKMTVSDRVKPENKW